MAELSKTAKASMVKEVKKTVAEESSRDAIHQIRTDRAGKLFVVRQDRIDKLLAAYDAIYEQLALLAWARTLESGKSYRVSVVQDEVSIEELSPEDIFTAYKSSPTIRQVMEEEEENNAESASN